MKTFRVLLLLPVLALGSLAFAGETNPTSNSNANTLAERTVKSVPVRVELPTFDRAIRALVDSAAREAIEENPVTIETPAVQAPDVFDARGADLEPASSAGHAAARNPGKSVHETAAPSARSGRAPLRVAGL